MLKYALSVAGACAATLALVAPAFADAPVGFAGTLSGSYTNWNFSGSGSGNANLWGADGQAAFGLGMRDIGAEIDGGYHNLTTNGSGNSSVDIWNIGGNLFWAPASQGRLGATVQYESLSGSGADAHLTEYGAFGEYYPSNMLTLGLNGGGWSGGSGSTFGSGGSGGYVGGGVTGYVMPDLALTGQINYFSGSGAHLTNYSAMGEYLISEATPVSIFGGYTYTDVSGASGHINQWLIGVKFYMNGNGSTLVDKQRNGALDSLVRPMLLIGG
jgi:hypothetical protein